MNRKSFIINTIGAISGLLTLGWYNKEKKVPAMLKRGDIVIKKKLEEKWGFIHINHLPKGRPGNWFIIDNKTGKYIRFSDREDYIDDGKRIDVYSLKFADDKTGTVGGIKFVFSNWSRECGLGNMLYNSKFVEERDIKIIYTENENIGDKQESKYWV